MTEKNINNYKYEIRENSITAKGIVQDKTASREGMSNIPSAGQGFHKGHIIAAQSNGAAVKENVTSQAADLNQGTYKKIENAEMRLVRNESAQIYTEKTAYFSNKNEGLPRSDAYMVNDTITYANGHENNVHLSLPNIPAAEQEQIAEESIQIAFDNVNAANPEDTLRDEMTVEEYTTLMEETDMGLPNISDEYAEHIEISYPMVEDFSGEHAMTEDTEISGEESFHTGAEDSIDCDLGNDIGDSSDFGIGDD